MLGLRIEADLGVEIAITAVKVFQCLDVLIEFRRRKDHATLLTDDESEQCGLIQFVVVEGHVADAVLLALFHLDRDLQLARRWVVVTDLVVVDGNIEKAFLPVVVPDLFQIVLKLLVLEAT
jgi:hypothetical protein